MTLHSAASQLPAEIFMRRERRRLEVRHIWIFFFEPCCARHNNSGSHITMLTQRLQQETVKDRCNV